MQKNLTPLDELTLTKVFRFYPARYFGARGLSTYLLPPEKCLWRGSARPVALAGSFCRAMAISGSCLGSVRPAAHVLCKTMCGVRRTRPPIGSQLSLSAFERRLLVDLFSLLTARVRVFCFVWLRFYNLTVPRQKCQVVSL